MAQEIGESRDVWGWNVMKMAEDFANNMKKETRPFYIAYCAKLDPHESKRLGRGAYRQAIKAYFKRPALMLGILVWYVNHKTGEFRFCPELSAPPDVPVDPSLLGEKAEDALPSVMEKGKELNVLVS